MLKDKSTVRINGVIFLMVWGWILGPMFTAISAFIWYVNRSE